MSLLNTALCPALQTGPMGSDSSQGACSSQGDSHVHSVEYARTAGEGAAAFEVTAFGGGVCRASLVAQLVKIPPAMWETWVRSLGWEDPLEKGKATHSSFLAWRIPWTIYSPWGLKELDTTE